MTSAPDEARNAARRLADLRERAAAAGLDIETYATLRAAKAAMKAGARAAKAAAAIRKPAPPGSTRMAVTATAEEAPQASPERAWLIAGVLKKGDLAVLDGDPGAAFSLALDAAIALASGVSAWAGRAVMAHRAKVLLLDLAFSSDVGARIRATELMRQIDTRGRLRISRGALLIGSRKSSTSFIAGVQEVGAPTIIVVNNLARLCETSSLMPETPADMLTLTEALRTIQSRLGHPAIIVLGGSDTYLGTAADRVLHVQHDGQNVSMTATGMSPMRFRLVTTRGVVLPISITNDKGF